jgi:hypothetical protein
MVIIAVIMLFFGPDFLNFFKSFLPALADDDEPTAPSAPEPTAPEASTGRKTFWGKYTEKFSRRAYELPDSLLKQNKINRLAGGIDSEEEEESDESDSEDIALKNLREGLNAGPSGSSNYDALFIEPNASGSGSSTVKDNTPRPTSPAEKESEEVTNGWKGKGREHVHLNPINTSDDHTAKSETRLFN